MFKHEIEVRHRRDPMAVQLGLDTPSESYLEITGISQDLTTCWKEVLSRMPTDLYTALKAAMGEHDART